MASRRITAPVRERINRLVDAIHDFLPLNSYYDHVITFETIFEESGVKKYLGKNKRPKKVRLREAFVKVFRYHQKLPYTFIRKIVPAGIEYRRSDSIRNPISQNEIDELITCLNELDINLENELKAIAIDESLPDIQLPPPEIVKRLEDYDLVKEIKSDPVQLFKDGHYNDAIRKACEYFETKVQHITNSSSSGKSLMSNTFSPSNPSIMLNDLKTQNDQNFQEGYMYLSMGMMQAIRNI